MRSGLIVVVVLGLAVFSGSCRWEEEYRTAETAQMASRLAALADSAKRDVTLPSGLSHPNRRSSGVRKDPYSRAERTVNRARTLLYSGRPSSAIETLRRLREEVLTNRIHSFGTDLTEIDELLAAAHLRRAQEQNCIDRPNSASCLFPIRSEGVYHDRRASRAAMKLYTRILRRNPEDKEAQWLLNLASMTLGEYPGQVPETHLISPDAFTTEHEGIVFSEVAAEVGVAETGRSGGSVMEDFDGDGDLDIMASSWGLRDQIRYYENIGNGTFRDRTVEAGLKGIVGGLNLVHGDFNNDGKPDVLVLRGAWKGNDGQYPNSLLKNTGEGTFTDVTEQANLLSFHPTQTAAWGDYNNDGWLDLFVGNETSPGSRHACALYRNDGDGTFTNVAGEVGLDVHGFVKGTAWGDYNNDGRLDLYLSRLGEPNLLFRNRGQQADGKRFVEVAEQAGVQDPINSFPTWFWDYNNDGRLDLFVSAFGPGYVVDMPSVVEEYLGEESLRVTPRLYENVGNGQFRNVTDAVELDRVLYGMGANYGDVDNDGFPDLYVGTGGPHFTSLIPNRLFRNHGGDAFQEVTSSARVGHLGKGHGVSFGDVEGDGDLDLFTVLGGAMPGDTYRNALFQNRGNANHWISVRLDGVQSNASAIGVRLTVVVDTGDGVREIHTVVSSGGSFGASSFRQHLGLGTAESVRSLRIRWPASGTVQTFCGLELDAAYRVREDKDEIIPISSTENESTTCQSTDFDSP